MPGGLEFFPGLLRYPTLRVGSMRRNIMEEGGTPVSSLLLSSWRSGSSLVGQILTSHPVTFYHYEPLHMYGLVKLSSGSRATEAVDLISSLLKCNYSKVSQYLAYQSSTMGRWCYAQNTRLWSSCTQAHNNTDLCFHPPFTSQFCKLFPFQAMKVVRLRVGLTEELVRDKKLDMKVMLLVRDPRAVLESRKHRQDFFPNCSDCYDPAVLCGDMLADYVAINNLNRKYPGRFKAIRFEDLIEERFIKIEEHK